VVRFLYLSHGAPPVAPEDTAVQEAAMADAVVAPSSYSQHGKFEILFPIALPDEGLELGGDEINPHGTTRTRW